MTTLGELAQELREQGIALEIRLKTETQHEFLFDKDVTDEQKALAEAAIAEWKKQPEDERRVTKDEANRKRILTEVDQLKAAVQADDKDALKQAVLKLLELAK